jgi:phosphatidylethanolamine-binding protein (PEBP) family uncharacterized protein
MSVRAKFPRWVGPTAVSCLCLVSACSSATDANPAAAGSTSLAGAANGGSPAGGVGGSSVAGAGTAGSASGGTAGGISGAAGAGAPAGGSGGAGGAAAGAAGTAGASAGAGGASGGAGAGGFALTSPAWTSQPSCAADSKTGCGVFPKESIGTNLSGGNKSPELAWSAGPSATQSYALVFHDLSNIVANTQQPFVHWVMWNIPGATRMLPASLETTAMPSVPAGSSQRNSFNGSGYQGSGKCGNVYEFVLYALPTAMFTPTGAMPSATVIADGLKATGAPTATLRARSGAPGCTE